MRKAQVSPLAIVPAAFISVLLLAGCSGSSSSSENPADDGLLNDETAVDVPEGNDTSPDEQNAADEPINEPVNEPLNEPANDEENDPASGADPLIQNSTRVNFDIEVPAYQSDSLQVRVTWGDVDTTAAWVGDEFWSLVEEFPISTTDLLSVFFNDDNGALTLGSFETEYRTGTNESESFQITADQFDVDSWDSDNDGVSNLAESIAGTSPVNPAGAVRILLFSETRGFRHDSIPAALLAFEELTNELGYETDLAADSEGVFTQENLSNYDAVAWVLTSGDVLDADEQSAFENFVRAGGGYVGIHAASDTEYDWPWYGDLVGAYFERHPQIQSATMNVENGSHISTEHLGATWSRTDEWYDFRTNPRARVNVLLTLEETTYSGGEMGDDHPIAWFHEFDGGRAWYTGGGHTVTSYSEPDFRAHLIGGVRYVVGDD